MARILVLSFSPLHADPRVHRQITLLSREHEVTAAGLSNPNVAGVKFVDVSVATKSAAQRALSAARLQLRRHESYYWHIGHVIAAQRAIAGTKFDLIVANDADAWPLAFALRGNPPARVLLDAHEYAPREFEDLWWWRWLYRPYREHLCRTYLPRAAAITTVCEGIAAEYARHFGVRPSVIMNVPPRRDAAPMAVPHDRVRMIHHGAAIRSRRIEVMIQALDHLDGRFSLDLMLVGNDTAYLASLRDLARNQPRVRFRDAVPMQRIVEETRDYDVGFFLLEPTNFNYLHALPNKLFEFIQARLAIAIGPSPEMARLVRQFECGVVADAFTPAALARALAPLTPETIARFKQNAHRAAAVLCWENEGETLRRVVRDVLSSAPCAA